MTNRSSSSGQQQWPIQRRLLYIFLFISGVALSVVALIYPFTTRSNNIDFVVGEVAGQDILAPYSNEYTSAVLTQQLQEEVAAAIEPVYAPPAANTARQQVNRLRAALAYIGNVRADSFASSEQKQADLAALSEINLSQDSALKLIELQDTAWDTVQQESIVVLEQIMRSTIREDRLEEARRTVPALVSLSVPEDQALLVAELVTAFVTPNSLYSETLTEAEKQIARDSIAPVTESYAANETIIQRGEVVTDLHIETLEAFGLTSNQLTWEQVTRAIIFVLINATMIAFFFNQRKELLNAPREVILTTIIFIVALYIGRLIVPGRTVMPYIFTSATFALLITALFNSQAAIMFTLPLSLLTAFELNNQLELSLYFLIPSIVGVLVLERAERLSGFFRAGTVISLTAIGMVLTFHLGNPSTDLIGLFTLIGAAAFNGLGSASLALVLQFFIAQMLGITTILQLLDLSRPDHPLLQFILRNAPGTYQHSLQIANLAEQAAEAIEANATLVRVGSLYHDAGKARQPHFFIENQVEGSHNPHDDLTPQHSAEVIIQHVPDGIEMAEKHRLPQSIKNFILEHHGTLITMYQYSKALELAGNDPEKVNREDFRYPGPRPQTRETALVMLADGCEARTRAERPEGEANIRALVKDVVDRRVAQGQLDDTTLTMQDLATIVDSFTTTLRGVYHPRIKYPEPPPQVDKDVDPPTHPSHDSDSK